ncbi:MAG TPA: hypothetical protein VMT54_01395 [Candidatus Cybelea sp.]|nr:hypothetical protein [Candidatus Cybelea sp.]
MATAHLHEIEAGGIRAVVDLRAGHVRALTIEQGGRIVAPLHTAPWIDDPSIATDESIPLNLRCLSGDFFCAPFAGSDLDDAPGHGWPANSPWKPLSIDSGTDGRTVARYELERPILGARLVKEFMLVSGHPFLYQRHIFIGGSGAIPVASHGMTRFDAPGALSFSPKLFGEAPPVGLEPDPKRGRSLLRYPARFTELNDVPKADGSRADLTRYPIASRHEDFVALVERPGNALGWAAALRPEKHDLFLSLKHPKDFPITMLWFSNGGRDYPPWNGRHLGVLGIEEGRTYLERGHRASIAPNPWSAEGITTALVLDPDGEVEVRHVIGGVALPEGWTRIVAVTTDAGRLTIGDQGGGRITVPFDAGFLNARR